MRLLALRPGHGEVLIAEGDVADAEQEQALIAAFRAQLDLGMCAAVPLSEPDGRRVAELVKSFDQVPRDADRVIFFPRAAGGG
jgi:molybdopterin converting factor small subunit